jgi:Protein of unknown function (DUF3141)
MRVTRYMFSESFNPWMSGLAAMAAGLEKSRTPVPQDHPFLQLEREIIKHISDMIEQMTESRDKSEEMAFQVLYGH